MGVIFTVISIIYIIYMCFKEEPDKSVSVLKWLLFLAIGGIIPVLIITSANEEIKPFGGLIFMLLIGFEALIFWAVSNRITIESKSKQEEINEQVEKRLDNIMQEFEDAGYHVNQYFIYGNNKFERVNEVLRREWRLNHRSNWAILYDYYEERMSRIDVVYDGYSKHQSRYLQWCDEDFLSYLLGVNISDLPLNQNVNRYDVNNFRIAEHRKYKTKGEIELRRMAQFPRGIRDDDIKKEAIRQRKELAIKYVVESRGLAYHEFVEGELPTDEEYLQLFDQRLNELRPITG